VAAAGGRIVVVVQLTIRRFLEQVSDDEMASLRDAVFSAASHRAAS
jgi:hypothetical protein